MKSAKPILIISMFVTSAIMVGIIVAVLANEGFNLPLLVVVGASLIIADGVMYFFFRNIWGGEVKDGIPAEATIVKMWDTGTTVNDNPLVGFTLEVRQPGQLAYQTESRLLISRLQVGSLRPGMTIPVKVDKSNPKRVEILPVEELLVPSTVSSADRLEELEELRTRRLISESEYNQKREEILKAL